MFVNIGFDKIVGKYVRLYTRLYQVSRLKEDKKKMSLIWRREGKEEATDWPIACFSPEKNFEVINDDRFTDTEPPHVFGKWRTEEYYPSDWREKIILARMKITHILADNFADFIGVRFVDDNCRGIVIQGIHAECIRRGFFFDIPEPIIRYDFSNIDEAVDEFIERWKRYDTPEQLNRIEKRLKNL